jgi:hypothetical protein
VTRDVPDGTKVLPPEPRSVPRREAAVGSST